MLQSTAHGVEASSLSDKLRGFLRDRAEKIAAQVAENGVDDLSNFIADELAASGETDLAEAVRCSGDAIETAIVTAMDARACLGSVKPATSFGAAVGGAPGAFIAGGIAALFNPSCRDALKGLLQTVDDVGDALGAVVDDIVGESQCAGGTFPAEDTLACADHCSSVLPDCSTWYFDDGCCLCKPYCDNTLLDSPSAPSSTSPSPDGAGYSPSPDGAGYSPSPDGAGYSPPSESSPGTCGTFEYDTDYSGGDIIPVTTKWADTAVPAASPEDCCEACTLYSYCQAWTFTDSSNCHDRLPGAPGCCYLKKATDWTATSSPGMVSGTTQGPPAASCTYEFDTDLAGGDILTADGTDTVVSTFSDADCCQSCARTPGCGAWTMTPPSNCVDSLGPNIVGCCFLKYSSGWTRTEDPDGVKTSGQLLSNSRRRA